MNKFILTLVLSAATLSALNVTAQDCNNFHKRKCNGSNDPQMAYNTQSKSGMFVLGHTSDLVFVAHAGHDYRISICQDKKVEEPVKFKIIDSRSKQVLFDNETAKLDTPDKKDKGDQSLPDYFEFTANVTKKIIVRITAPGPPPEEGQKASKEPNPEDLFCVGVLLESMPSPDLGF